MRLKKTKKLITGLSTAALVMGITGCGNTYTHIDETEAPKSNPSTGQATEIPPVPDANEYCEEYEWDASEGYYECDDDDSHYYGHYFYNRGFYRAASDIRARNKPAFTLGATNKPSSSSSSSSSSNKPNSNTSTQKSSSASNKSSSFSNSSGSSSKSSGFGSSSSSSGG